MPTPLAHTSRLGLWHDALSVSALHKKARLAQAQPPTAGWLDRISGSCEREIYRAAAWGANLRVLQPVLSPHTKNRIGQGLGFVSIGTRLCAGVLCGALVGLISIPFLIVSDFRHGSWTIRSAAMGLENSDSPTLALLHAVGTDAARTQQGRQFAIYAHRTVCGVGEPVASWRDKADPFTFSLSQGLRLNNNAKVLESWKRELQEAPETILAATAERIRFFAGNQSWRLHPNFSRSHCPDVIWSVAQPVTDQDILRLHCHAQWHGQVPLMRDDGSETRHGAELFTKTWTYPHPLHLAVTIDIDRASTQRDEPVQCSFSVAPGGLPRVDGLAYPKPSSRV